MAILGDFIITLARIIDVLLTVYSFIILAVAVISWLNISPYNPILRYLYLITEPLLKPIRKRLKFKLSVDISPLILLIIVFLIQRFLIVILIEFGYSIKGGNL